MKRLAVIAFVVLSAIPSFANETVIEFATGAGSPHWITSNKWRGAVGRNGLYFKEYALRVSRKIHERARLYSTVGWLKEREFVELVYADVIGASGFRRNRESAYFSPSISLSAGPFSFDIGAIIYKSNDDINGIGSPFEKYHSIAPSLGLELGDENAYMAIRIFDAFPLYAGGGGFEIDLGRRWYGIYDHKILFYGGIFESIGLGYRGEYKIYGRSAISIGFMAGGNDHHDNIYSFTAGIKTALAY